MAGPRSLARFLLVPVLIFAQPALAVDGLRLSLGSTRGAGWAADRIVVTLRGLRTATPTVQLQVAHLRLSQLGQSLDDLDVTCTSLRRRGPRIQCSDGHFAATSSALSGRLAGTLDFDYRPSSGAGWFAVHDLAVAGGKLSLTARLAGRTWRADLTAVGLQVGQVLARLQKRGLLRGYTGKGAVDLSVRADGAGTMARSIGLKARFHRLTFSNASGTHASQNLGLAVGAALTRERDSWAVRTEVHASQGQLYADPLYLEVTTQPMVLRAQGHWYPARRQLQVNAFQWTHPGVVEARGTATLDLGTRPRLTAVDLQVAQGNLGGLYTDYLQPWLLGTLAGNLRGVAGSLHGRVRYRAGALQAVELHLANAAMEGRQGRFAFKGLSGDLDWGRNAVQRRSDISWTSGSFYRLPLGPAHIALQSQGMQFRLQHAVRIPVLDGDLLIDKAGIQNAGTAQMRWNVAGVLTPVSLGAFTKAVGWPALSGKISGVVPEVTYRDGTVRVGGVLLVRVFGGDITVRDLRMEQPFGLVPRMQADIKVDRINLDTLTRTFSFGQIQGLLSGYVRNLHMVDWRPVSFDAAFATPPDDHSRHRISQKALDNLSSIGGGGVGSALSRGFLRLFQDFPYDRLGISCRLHDGICDMNGVAPAQQGYYIVKGRFLPPRVDVIGYAHQVDWNTLIRQLKAATAAQGPAVR